MTRATRRNARVGALDVISQPISDSFDATKSALLRNFYAKLAMRNTAPVDWVAIGDSTTEGARQSAPSNRWENRVLAQLRSRMGQAVAGGFGYLPAWYSTGDMQNVSPSVFQVSGTPTSASTAVRSFYGLGRRCVAMSGTTQKFVLTLAPGTVYASTSVDVIFAKTANATTTLDIYVNDVLATSINTVVPSNSVSAGNRFRVSGLNPASTNTIEARCNGASVYFEGWMLYNGDETAGIRLWEASSSGSNAAYHALTAAASKLTPNFVYSYDNMVAIQPSLVTIMLGINSYYNSGQTETAPGYGTSLAQIIANVRAACTTAPSIVLINQWERGSVPGGQAYAWADYLAQAYALVASDGGIGLFDAQKRFPAGPQTTTLGLINADTIHITDTGGGFLGDQFINWLLPR